MNRTDPLLHYQLGVEKERSFVEGDSQCTIIFDEADLLNVPLQREATMSRLPPYAKHSPGTLANSPHATELGNREDIANDCDDGSLSDDSRNEESWLKGGLKMSRRRTDLPKRSLDK